MKLPSDVVAQLSVQNGWERVEVCASASGSASTERLHFYSRDEGRDLMNKVICFIDRQSTHRYHLFV